MFKIKRIISIALTVTMLVTSFIISVDALEVDAEIDVEYSGVANPNGMVTMLVVDSEAEQATLKNDDIYAVEIVRADARGKFAHTFTLKDAEVNHDTMEIENYKVISNGKITKTAIKSTGFIHSYKIDGVKTINGVVYIPISESVFKTIAGDSLEAFTYNEATQTYKGEANNGPFEIKTGKDTVEVDWVDIELPAPVKTVDGVDMVPLYAVKYLFKTGDVSYNSATQTVKIKGGVQNKGIDWNPDLSEKLDYILGENPEETAYWERAEDGNKLDQSTIKLVRTDKNYGRVFQANHIDPENDSNAEVAIKFKGLTTDEIALALGHVGLFHFKARAINATNAESTASAQVFLQRRNATEMINQVKVPQFTTALDTTITLPYIKGEEAEWQDFYFVADCSTTQLGDYSWVKILFPAGSQGIEFCDLQLWDLGLISDPVVKAKYDSVNPKGYKGIEDDHVWRQEAWNRIEKYRKEDINIQVKDKNGNPVSGAVIDVKMTDNEFMFGGAMCAVEITDDTWENGVGRAKLDDFINNYSNAAVIADDLKADGILGYNAETGIAAVNELLSRGKRVRGHAVFWDGMNGIDNYYNLTYEEVYKKTMDYVRPLVHTFKGKLEQWDCLNELFYNDYMRVNFNTTKLYSDILKEIKRIDPDVKLYINETAIEGKAEESEYDIIPEYSRIIKQLREEDAPIDGIGIQAHCTKYFYPMGFYHQIDELSKLVDEVAVTEYDMYNGEKEYLPNHMEDLMLAVFSHPKATAFIAWNPQDSMHWRANANAAPFFDRSWNEKPAYDVWKKLVSEDFATNTSLVTDGDGNAFVRAYRGDYDITCTYEGKTTTVALGNTNDNGSGVVFTVEGNHIKGNSTNPVRTKVTEPIEYENMTQAKQAYDAEHRADYKGIILEHNIKNMNIFADNAPIINGVSLVNNTEYQSGKIWASPTGKGVGGIFANDSDISAVVYSDGTDKAGEIYHKASGNVRYEELPLCFETMFYTLNPQVNGNCSIDVVAENKTYTNIAYNNGKYVVRTMGGAEKELETDEKYTLRLTISNDGNELKTELLQNEDVYYTQSEQIGTPVIPTEIDEVGYKIDVSCGKGNIFKIHNARLYEHSDGEFLRLGRTDYKTVVLDESMNLDLSSIEYIGNDATNVSDNWGLIGNDSDPEEFFIRNKYKYLTGYAKATGGDTLVRSIDKLVEGESLDISFEMYNEFFTVSDHTGEWELALTNREGTQKLTLFKHTYRPPQNGNDGHSVKLIGVNDVNYAFDETVFRIYDNGNPNPWHGQNITFKANAIPSVDGYSLSMTAISYDGETLYDDTVTVPQELIEGIDMIAIKSHSTSTGVDADRVTSGVKNIKIAKYGKTIYESDSAKLPAGEKVSLGIAYDNVTGVNSPVVVFVAGYNETGQMVECKSIDYTIKTGENALHFNITPTNMIKYYKVFLFDGTGTFRPCKSHDLLEVVEN